MILNLILNIYAIIAILMMAWILLTNKDEVNRLITEVKNKREHITTIMMYFVLLILIGLFWPVILCLLFIQKKHK